MKIVFLDIDGVLNGHERHPGSEYCGTSPGCVAELNRVLAATGALVVVCSAWRYLVLRGAMTVEGLRHLLSTHGVVGPPGVRDYLLGVTESDEQVTGRDLQVWNWVCSHPEIVSWVIFDDMEKLYDQWHIKNRLVLTDGKVGMTTGDADRAIDLLGRVTG